jgi:pimeloyl-ACP methyl ester carboxylesterase
MHMTATADGQPTVLLVHGAWHRSSCWEKLQDALAAEGWDSRTVDLPSSGTQSTPTAGMHDDARVISEQLRGMADPVVIVGHSYGGIPVTQAAGEHPNVSHVVYLAAYMPDEGQSMYDIHGLPAPDDTSGVFPLIDDPRASLYGDLSDDEAQREISRLVDQSLRSFAEKVTQPTWRSTPSTYIICEKDKALPPALQEVMAAQATNVERLESGHTPFLSRPAELAALLGKIISAAPSKP